MKSADSVKSHLTQSYPSHRHCRGADYATPDYASLAGGLFSVEGNQNLTDSGKAFYLPLNCLKEFRKGVCTRKRITIKITFSSKNLAVWPGKHFFYQTFALLLILVIAFLPFEAPNPISFFSSGWYVSLNCLVVFRSHSFVGFLDIQT